MYRIIISAMYDDKSLNYSDKEQWLIDNLNFTEKDARNAVYALEGYSDRGYRAIHNQDFSGYLGDQNVQDAKMIDTVLTHPNMPKYSGILYRGLVIPRFNYDIESILNSGIWREPGITSFTTSLSKAKEFANADSLHDPVILTLEGNRHACEVGFLSQSGGEGEVLYPSVITRKGLKIVDWHKDVVYGQRLNKKTGRPKIIHENYFVNLRDW